MNENTIKELAITWELCGGRELSQPAQDLLVLRLTQFDDGQIRRALQACQIECDRLSLKHIIDKINEQKEDRSCTELQREILRLTHDEPEYTEGKYKGVLILSKWIIESGYEIPLAAQHWINKYKKGGE